MNTFKSNYNSISSIKTFVIALPVYVMMPMRGVLGAIVGYLTGCFVKQASKIIAWYLGIGLITIGILVKKKYLIVNWKKIDEELFRHIFRS